MRAICVLQKLTFYREGAAEIIVQSFGLVAPESAS